MYILSNRYMTIFIFIVPYFLYVIRYVNTYKKRKKFNTITRTDSYLGTILAFYSFFKLPSQLFLNPSKFMFGYFPNTSNLSQLKIFPIGYVQDPLPNG